MRAPVTLCNEAARHCFEQLKKGGPHAEHHAKAYEAATDCAAICVLTISIHESPQTLFPGTGWPTEIGGPSALGTAVNIAVPAGTNDLIDDFLDDVHGGLIGSSEPGLLSLGSDTSNELMTTLTCNLAVNPDPLVSPLLFSIASDNRCIRR